jgi:hypothetical protein
LNLTVRGERLIRRYTRNEDAYLFCFGIIWKGMTSPAVASRSDLLRRGLRLEYFTVPWNTLEALISLVAGLIAGSIVQMAFGADSRIRLPLDRSQWWRRSPLKAGLP